jgi:uncharacterized membrane protein YebE (DUF533 family)
MFDAAKLLQQLLHSPTARGFAGGVAGSMLLGRSGRKLAGKAVKLGGLAAIGALAYRAYQNHQAQKQGRPMPSSAGPAGFATVDGELAPPPAASGFLPPPSDSVAQQSLGLVLVRAMVAAAKADGKLDADETRRILGSLDDRGLSGEERAALLEELSHPVDVDRLVAAAPTPELAAEVYVAARSAIDPDTAAEKAWLALLAARLGLEAGLVDQLERELGA